MKQQDENIMSASATQGGLKKYGNIAGITKYDK